MMAAPRGIEDRIRWFLNTSPGDVGMCARHSWRSLGGDRGNPPAWGCPDANAVYDKVKASKRYFTGPPPRGALVLWKYGKHGHAAISAGNGKIVTTDPSGKPGGTGTEPLSYPSKWGAKGYIWTDQYNGVRFDVEGSATVGDGKVLLSKLKYGQRDSDSVSRLQMALNAHPLKGGQGLPISGNYLKETDEEVRLCQQQHGFGYDPAGKSSVGPKQAAHLFAGTGHTVVNDLTPAPEPEEPPVTTDKRFIYKYSGKPSGVQAIGTSYTEVELSSFTPPGDGFLLSMLYLNCQHTFDSGVNEAGFRVRAVREAWSGGPVDYTGYGDFTPNRHLTKPGEFVLTHLWFELCDGGRPVHWEVDRSSAFGKFELGTRYTKWVWISASVFESLTRTLGLTKEQVAEMLRAYLDAADDEPRELAA